MTHNCHANVVTLCHIAVNNKEVDSANAIGSNDVTSAYSCDKRPDDAARLGVLHS